MTLELEFVKGHCGWDVVTLLPEGQIAPDQELPCALKIVSAPVDGGLEVGLLGPGERPDEIRLRMVSSTARDWIAMCGGMTQVIGKALVETFLRERFKIDVSQAPLNLKLLTPSGEIPIRIAIDAGTTTVITTMDHYAAYLYRLGIEQLTFEGVTLLRVGDYAVIDVQYLEARHPQMDFTRRDAGRHLDIVNEILRLFGQRIGVTGVTAMLFDARPEGPGQYRVFPRFYSEDLAAARLPWEFQCGTGSIAVAIALAHQARLPFAEGDGEITFEWGSYRATPDPYGIRTSNLTLGVLSRRVSRITFRHSVVEILAEGKLRLPGW